jgi:hypothetical protein
MIMPDVATLDSLELHSRGVITALERARGYCNSVAGHDAINDAKCQAMEVLHVIKRVRACKKHERRHDQPA